jgi:hypothetical protein
VSVKICERLVDLSRPKFKINRRNANAQENYRPGANTAETHLPSPIQFSHPMILLLLRIQIPLSISVKSLLGQVLPFVRSSGRDFYGPEGSRLLL